MSNEVCGNQALLQSLAEGVLTGDEAEVVKSHVSACNACRIAVIEYKQMMWDLGRPPQIELPPELDRSYDALMKAWKKERDREREGALQAKGSGSMVPAWATYSVSWTRNLPAVGAVGSLVRRTGAALIGRSLPRWKRRKGGERD